MLLLLLQMKPTSASQASWLRMRTPVKLGARFRKLASAEDHCVYRVVREWERLKYEASRASVSSANGASGVCSSEEGRDGEAEAGGVRGAILVSGQVTR